MYTVVVREPGLDEGGKDGVGRSTGTPEMRGDAERGAGENIVVCT